MITVYKYSLENWRKNVCRVILPIGAEILRAGVKCYDSKGEQIDIWAKVDTSAAEEVCYFYVVKTGENITKRLEQRDKNKKLEYISDFWDRDIVHWHIFKAAAAYSFSTITTPYWGNSNLQPLTLAKTLASSETGDNCLFNVTSTCNNSDISDTYSCEASNIYNCEESSEDTWPKPFDD